MEMTVRETIAVEKLRFWKLQEFITPHQAAMLALGLDPGSELFGFNNSHITPQGYEPIKHSLVIKLTAYHYNRLDEESGEKTFTYDALFCPENIHTPSIDSNDFSCVSVYRVRQKVIKLWLEEQGIYSGYFEGVITPTSEVTGHKLQKVNTDNLRIKNKDWLTMDDASRQLASLYQEDVCAKDVLQLVVENKLQISYYLPPFTDLLTKDEDTMYGWSNTPIRKNEQVFTLKVDGVVQSAILRVVFEQVDIDTDLIESEGCWWSVFDEQGIEYRPIDNKWREEEGEECFADKVENVPFLYKWLVIERRCLLDFIHENLNSKQKTPDGDNYTFKITIQQQREQLLAELINQREQADLITLGRLGVWKELTKMNSELFPFRDNSGDSTLKKFFDNQKLITFKRGR